MSNISYFIVVLIIIQFNYTQANGKKVFCYYDSKNAIEINLSDIDNELNLQKISTQSIIGNKDIKSKNVYSLVPIPDNFNKLSYSNEEKELMLKKGMGDAITISKKCIEELHKIRKICVDIRVGTTRGKARFADNDPIVVPFFAKTEDGKISNNVKYYRISPKNARKDNKRYGHPQLATVELSLGEFKKTGTVDIPTVSLASNPNSTTQDELVPISARTLLQEIIRRNDPELPSEFCIDQDTNKFYKFECKELNPLDLFFTPEGENQKEKMKELAEIKKALIESSSKIHKNIIGNRVLGVGVSGLKLLAAALKSALVAYQRKHMSEDDFDKVMLAGKDFVESLTAKNENIKVDLKIFDNNKLVVKSRDQKTNDIITALFDQENKELVPLQNNNNE